jgi:4-hydroxy-tetrahydrodipicolinate reductase
MKKVSVIGAGKTGSKVIELLKNHTHFELSEIFHSKNEPTHNKILNSDAIIIFVNGEVLQKHLKMLAEIERPIICGTTGFDYAPFSDILSKRKSSWIYGSNFSLGVHLMRKMIEEMREGLELFDNPTLSIHEIHHTKKIDSPSGTAKSMASWFGEKVASAINITAERTGDVVGTHTLTLKTQFETLKLEHIAHDRFLFASGALKTLELNYQTPIDKKFLSIEEFLDLTLFNKKRTK